MLARLHIGDFTVRAADIDETPRPRESPRDYARRMAREKALAAPPGESHVLAGDTVVALGRRILPKADDAGTARDCLERLSGRRHRVQRLVDQARQWPDPVVALRGEHHGEVVAQGFQVAPDGPDPAA